ncbi:MAG: hypothetical protein IJ829_05195 [Kiritimatiellae bacterium]|nr:hypothetical protein [Kiritimatiellia bacterium]
MRRVARAAFVVLAASLVFPLGPAHAKSGLGTICSYLFHIKECGFGGIDLGGDTEVAIYKIGADGQSLGAKLASAKTGDAPTQTAGASAVVNLTVYTTGDDETAEIGEQLAVVVTGYNNYGNGAPNYVSYTILPPPTFQGVYEVAGLLGAESTTNRTYGAGLPTMYINCIDNYSDYYLWDNGYPTASDDLDGDGKTTIEEFYAGTDPTGGQLADAFGWFDTLTLKDWRVTGKKATVKIDRTSGHVYSIRWTTENPKITTLGQDVPTGKKIKFATEEGGSESTDYFYSYSDDPLTSQVWFTLPDVEENYYVGIAVDGVLCAYTKIEAKASDPLQDLIDAVNASDQALAEAQKELVSSNILAVAELLSGDNAAKAEAIETWLKGLGGDALPAAADIADARLTLTYTQGADALITSATTARIDAFNLSSGDSFALSFTLLNGTRAINFASPEAETVAAMVVCSTDVTFADPEAAFAAETAEQSPGTTLRAVVPGSRPITFCKISF